MNAETYGPLFSKLKIPKALRSRLRPKDWKSGLILGPPGHGKSHTAAARLLGGMLSGGGLYGSALYVSVPELLAELKFAYERKEPTEPIMDPVLASKYVVLDDLGAEREGEWTFDQLYLILNYRQSRMLPTVATSNLSPDLLSAKMGARAASRLFALGEVELKEGHDYRVQPAPEIAENARWIDDAPETTTRSVTNPPEPGSDFDFEKEAPGLMQTIYLNMGHANSAAYDAFWSVQNAEYRKAYGHPPNEIEMRRRENLVRTASNGQKVAIELQSGWSRP